MAVRRAFGSSAAAADSPQGAVYATYSALGSMLWDHVLVANLSAPFELLPRHLASTRADAALRRQEVQGTPAAFLLPLSSPASAPLAGAQLTVAYALDPRSLDRASLAVQLWDAATPIHLEPCGLSDYALWHSAPLLDTGGGALLGLLGELGKYVPVAEARFWGLQAGSGALAVGLVGQAFEAVSVSLVEQGPASGAGSGGGSLTVYTVDCTLSEAGTAMLTTPGAAAGSSSCS
jgi:hypothetical protein